MLWARENRDLRAEELASDLLSLKIETILSSRITGGAMGDPRIGLCEIAGRYATAFSPEVQAELSELLKPVIEEATGSTPATLLVSGGRMSFFFFKVEARRELEELGKRSKLEPEEQRRFHRLERIWSNSRAIYSILCTCDPALRDEERPLVVVANAAPPKDDRRAPITPNPLLCNDGLTKEYIEARYATKQLPPLKLTRRQVTRLRKIWEIGLETIVMQTVVQIDGDVVTRVDPDQLTRESALLLEIHNRSIGVSVGYWKELVQLAATLVKGLWDAVFPKRHALSRSAQASPS